MQNTSQDALDLTDINLISFLWDIGNRIAPDVTPQYLASHLGLFYLLKRVYLKVKKLLIMPLKLKVDSSQ